MKKMFLGMTTAIIGAVLLVGGIIMISIMKDGTGFYFAFVLLMIGVSLIILGYSMLLEKNKK